jgi:hypothetical protein
MPMGIKAVEIEVVSWFGYEFVDHADQRYLDEINELFTKENIVASAEVALELLNRPDFSLVDTLSEIGLRNEDVLEFIKLFPPEARGELRSLFRFALKEKVGLVFGLSYDARAAGVEIVAANIRQRDVLPVVVVVGPANLTVEDRDLANTRWTRTSP